MEFDPQNYLDHIGEHVEDWSYLKFPFYRNKAILRGRIVLVRWED